MTTGGDRPACPACGRAIGPEWVVVPPASFWHMGEDDLLPPWPGHDNRQCPDCGLVCMVSRALYPFDNPNPGA